MKNRNKKIYLLFAGGTALDEKNIAGSSVNKKEDTGDWLERVPEIMIMAQIEPVFVSGGRQELSGIKLWQKISQLIAENQEADGFVILADLEEILPLGIALCFALTNLNKPVILTGSQITPKTIELPDWPEKKKKSYGGLGVKANLINAVQLANLELPAVALIFGNRIISPVKAKRIQTIGLNLFDSVDEHYLGRIDFGISLNEMAKEPESKLELKNQFEENIQIINYQPNFNLADNLNQKARAIIIRDLPGLADLNLDKINQLVLIYSRFMADTGEKKDNVIMADNLTWETALIKLMWCLGQGNELSEAMNRGYCHEFIKH
jgi:L-asparaginase/Glu-tRNA(Gln) amidotransferase subunit D